MKSVGLWIDEYRAVIVSNVSGMVDVRFINSGIDACRWQFAVWSLPTEMRQRMDADDLDRFYTSVSKCVYASDSIFIFGPDQAKNHLHDRLSTDHFRGMIVGVELSGKMKNSQIVAKVRDRFIPRLRQSPPSYRNGKDTENMQKG